MPSDFAGPLTAIKRIRAALNQTATDRKLRSLWMERALEAALPDLVEAAEEAGLTMRQAGKTLSRIASILEGKDVT